MKIKTIFFASLLIMLCVSNTFPCSSFSFKNNERVIMGKNYDWSTGIGVLMTNPAGHAKLSYPMHNGETFNWTSKYASITFNQYGKNMPNGGMNQEGLAIEVLWLGNTIYAEPKHAKAVNELQFVQLILDNCKNVKEAIGLCQKFYIKPIFGKLHYFLSDRTANSALIEFIDGEMKIYTGESQPYKAITNDTYEKSLEYKEKIYRIKKITPFRIGAKGASLNRFSRTAQKLKAMEMEKDSLVEKSFNMLADVELKSTKWSIVYDLTAMKIFYKTKEAGKIKAIDFNKLVEGKEHKFVDLNAANIDNVKENLNPFGSKDNFELIKKSTQIVGVPLSEQMLEAFAYYPDNISNASKVFYEYFNSVGNITIEIENLKKDYGYVYLGIYDSEENMEKNKAFNGGKFGVEGDNLKVVLYNVPLNKEYAIGYYHDENNNYKLDTNIVGIPKEKYGFSGKGRKFKKAKFLFEAEAKEMKIAL